MPDSPEELPGKALELATQASKLFELFLGTETAKELDGLVGDQLKHWRLRRSVRLMERTRAFLAKRGIDVTRDVAPSVLMPLLQAGSLADDGMADRWAALLASAADPSRPTGETVGLSHILEQLSPDDAELLDRILLHAVQTLAHKRPQGVPLGDMTDLLRHPDLTQADLVVTWRPETNDYALALNRLHRHALVAVTQAGPTRSGSTGVLVDYADVRRGVRLTPLGQTFACACLSPDMLDAIRAQIS